MNQSRLKSVSAWLLIAAQAITIGLGPGLVLCREADGSSHFELRYEECCDGSVSDPSHEVEPVVRSEQSDICLDADCVDEPVSQDLASRQRRSLDAEIGGDSLFVPPALPNYWFQAEFVDPGGQSFTLDATASPAYQTLRVLSATILIL